MPSGAPDPDAFARDVLPGLLAILAVLLALFGGLIIAWRATTSGSLPDYRAAICRDFCRCPAQGAPGGASPNRPPYSATPQA